jgi:hypothetical protein
MKTFKKTIWDVSYELERIAEILFNSDFAHTNTIFDRARIEEDMFYDVMDLLLHMYGSEGTIEFMDKYYKLRNVNMNRIDNFQEIFEEFKRLIGQKLPKK